MLKKLLNAFADWLNMITDTESGLVDIYSLRKESDEIRESMERERQQYQFLLETNDRPKIDFSSAIPKPHEQSCRNCKYWTKEYNLKCAVNPSYPSLLKPYEQTDCKDFEREDQQ